MRSKLRPCLLALCAAAFGCTDGGSKTQVLTGKVTRTGAVAVRVISDGNVVTAGRIRSDGSFTLSVPAGVHYRLEVLTANGVQHVMGHDGSAVKEIAFSVCQ